VSPAKTAEPIEMLFWMWTRVGSKNRALDGDYSKSPHVKLQRWGRKGAGPGHTRTCPAVDILKATRQGAAPVRCGCRLRCTRWGAHWRDLANTIVAATKP